MNMNEKVMRNKYKSLARYIGMPLRYIRGLNLDEIPDGKVEIIADYADKVLVQLEYIKSAWGLQMPPRRIKTLVPKAAMACGDVLLAVSGTGEILSADSVAYYQTVEESLK